MAPISAPGNIGFDDFYSAHDKKTWSNYWRPFLFGMLCVSGGMMIFVSPVVTTARPDRVRCADTNSSFVDRDSICVANCTKYVM